MLFLGTTTDVPHLLMLLLVTAAWLARAEVIGDIQHRTACLISRMERKAAILPPFLLRLRKKKIALLRMLSKYQIHTHKIDKMGISCKICIVSNFRNTPPHQYLYSSAGESYAVEMR